MRRECLHMDIVMMKMKRKKRKEEEGEEGEDPSLGIIQ